MLPSDEPGLPRTPPGCGVLIPLAGLVLPRTGTRCVFLVAASEAGCGVTDPVLAFDITGPGLRLPPTSPFGLPPNVDAGLPPI